MRETLERVRRGETVDLLKSLAEDLALLEAGGILCFGMLIYSEENPEIRRLLRDPLIQEELEATTGERFVMFLLRDVPRMAPESACDQSLSRLEPVGSFSADTREAQKKVASGILDAFAGRPILVQYPSMLIFQTLKGVVVDALLVSLAKPTIHETHVKLREVCRAIASALGAIDPENFGNRSVIMWNVKQSLDTAHFFSEVIPVAKSILGILKKAHGLFF